MVGTSFYCNTAIWTVQEGEIGDSAFSIAICTTKISKFLSSVALINFFLWISFTQLVVDKNSTVL